MLGGAEVQRLLSVKSLHGVAGQRPARGPLAEGPRNREAVALSYV